MANKGGLIHVRRRTAITDSLKPPFAPNFSQKQSIGVESPIAVSHRQGLAEAWYARHRAAAIIQFIAYERIAGDMSERH